MALSEMYDSGGGNIDISRLLDDAKALWPRRANGLYNIGTATSKQGRTATLPE